MTEEIANGSVDGLPIYDDFPKFHYGMRTIDDKPLWDFEYRPENHFSTLTDDEKMRGIEAAGGCTVTVSDVAVDGRRCKCFHLDCTNPHDVLMPEKEWARLHEDNGWTEDDPYLAVRLDEWLGAHRGSKCIR